MDTNQFKEDVINALKNPNSKIEERSEDQTNTSAKRGIKIRIKTAGHEEVLWVTMLRMEVKNDY